MKSLSLIVSAAALVALTGCSSVDRAGLARGDDLAAKSAALKEGAVEWKLYVAPVEVECKQDVFDDKQTDHYGMVVDRERLGDEIGRVLGGHFAKVKVHEDAKEGRAEAANAAFREGYDLMLVPKVQRWNAVFVKTNGWWWPNALFVAWYLYFPIWWIGDEVFGADAQLAYDVVSVRNEHRIAELSGDVVVDSRKVTERPGEDDLPLGPRVTLDDLDRGIDILGTYHPGSLDRDQWAKSVAPIIEPYARRSSVLALADDVARRTGKFRNLDARAQATATAAVHAVVVGVGQYGPTDECPCADKDAVVFSSWLTGEPVAADAAPLRTGTTTRLVPNKLVTTLTNARATKADVEAALAKAVQGSRPEDVVIFYFAGRGARGTKPGLGGLGLACYGADRRAQADAATVLPLERVRELLQQAPARRRLVVVDASFASGLRGTDGEAKANEPVTDRRIAELLAPIAGSEGAVVLASRPDEPAHVYDAARHGLFTYALVDGLYGAADVDNQGVTWEALDKHVVRCVTTVSELDLGSAQHPIVIAPARRARVLEVN